MELIPGSLFLSSLLFIPKSPRCLVAAGQEDEARDVINRLSTAGDAEKESADIRSTVSDKCPSLSDIVQEHTGRVHPLVWVGVGPATFQKFTGINVVFYYGSTLWQAAGFTESVSLLSNVVTGAVNIGFTFVAIALVDRLGRKPLLLVDALGQAVMLGVMTYAFGTAGTSTALSLSGLVQWLSNFTMTMTFPILLDTLGLGVPYGIYAAFGVVAFVFVRRFVKGTKERTPEDMSREA